MQAMRNLNDSAGPEKLDSDLLRTFLAISDAGSFTRGAEQIFRSQSAASLQIKRLEQIIGLPVFERNARGIDLTSVGEKLLPVARRVVGLLDTTAGELRTDGIKGTLRIGIPDEYGSALLPQMINRFAVEHPRVELSVRCGFSAGFPQALARDELDLAIHSVETVPYGSQLLIREKAVWAASRHHDVTQRNPLPVAMFDRACWWRDKALAALRSTGRHYRLVYSSESVTGVMAAISAGVAVGVLAQSAVGNNMKVLGTGDGFAPMPESLLVLERGPGGQSQAAIAAAQLIRRVFQESE